MLNNMKLGSADWNFWPISREYEVIFPEFKRIGIDNVEIGIYLPSNELQRENRKRILEVAHKNNITISAALFSLTPDRWPNGAFSNLDSTFLVECELFFDALEELGIKFANFWTGADFENSDSDATEKSLDKLDKLAQNFSGLVSIEYKANTIFPSGRELANKLSKYSHLKVLIDTGHAFALDENVIELIQKLNETGLMGAMHLGDALIGDSDADLPCGRFHDFTEILDTLSKIDFKGSANFDLYGAAIDESGPGPRSVVHESLIHINSAMRAS